MGCNLSKQQQRIMSRQKSHPPQKSSTIHNSQINKHSSIIKKSNIYNENQSQTPHSQHQSSRVTNLKSEFKDFKKYQNERDLKNEYEKLGRHKVEVRFSQAVTIVD